MNTRFCAWIAIVTVLLSACGGGDGEGNNSNGSSNNNGGPAFDGPAVELHATAPDIKTLQLAWPDAPAETGYRVYEQLEGSPDAVEVASLPANTTQYRLSVFLPERLNARYSVQDCNAGGCTTYTEVATAGNAVLNQVIGYFKSNGTTFIGRAWLCRPTAKPWR